MLLNKVEPYWNVKLIDVKLLLGLQAIKVEPYWNVKISAIRSINSLAVIKVEAYWNVKNCEWEDEDVDYILK